MEQQIDVSLSLINKINKQTKQESTDLDIGDTATNKQLHKYKGAQNLPQQNMLLWHQDYVELVIF